MVRKISEKAHKAGMKVINIAKKLRKEHPKTPWKELMKKAGAEYRAQKKK